MRKVHGRPNSIIGQYSGHEVRLKQFRFKVGAASRLFGANFKVNTKHISHMTSPYHYSSSALLVFGLYHYIPTDMT